MPVFVLASASPRRRGLLQAAGLVPDRIVSSEVPEERGPDEAPIAYARRLARDKAIAIAQDLPEDTPPTWVLAADTVVHLDQLTFEKPADSAEAQAMIRALSGRWHQVTSAWFLAPAGGVRRRVRRGHSTAKVSFRKLRDEEIAAYVAAGESLDKAGAYGVQSLGAALVDRVVGTYSTVVGLPMNQVVANLRAVGIVAGGA